MRALFAAILTCVLGLGATARVLDGYARRHFLPNQRLRDADAAGEHCILVLGDSRMDAGFDGAALRRGLGDGAGQACVAQLAIGATDIAGHFVTAREYLAHGKHPLVAVLGMAGDSLLGPKRATRPEEMGGNQAIHLVWTKAGDVFAEEPGFPLADVGVFDDGFRFLMDRGTAFGRYQSLVTVKWQGVTERLTHGGAMPGNRFGALGDMAALADQLRLRAPDRLAEAMRGGEAERLGPWFTRLSALLADAGVRLVAVELPMPRRFQSTVSELPQALAYRRWLDDELARRGDLRLDLSREPWVDDDLFVDTLHLGPRGAEQLSLALGQRLAPLVNAARTR